MPEREIARAHLNNALCMIALALDVELTPETFRDSASYRRVVELLGGVRGRIEAANGCIEALLARTRPYSHVRRRLGHYL